MGVAVSEIYSPPRVTARAGAWGLTPRAALDLTCGWDFSRIEDRLAAEKLIDEQDPELLIGSPMCTAFSTLQQWSFPRMEPGHLARMWEEATDHLRFCCKLYKKRREKGKKFLHEHPARATSWETEEIKGILKLKGVRRVTGNMCAFGMTSRDQWGEGFVCKPTGFMSNSEEILEELERKCTNPQMRNEGRGGEVHRHVPLLYGRAGPAAIYPPALVAAILRWLKRHIEGPRRTAREINSVDKGEGIGDYVHEEDSSDERWEAWDDVSGACLDPELVRAARGEELKEFGRVGVWKIRPITECVRVTGKRPIGTRWVDINKGDKEHPDYRSRLVAQDVNTEGMEGIFAAMPPLEAKKMLFSMATSSIHQSGKPYKLGFIDIKKAYLYAKVRRDTYVRLPQECNIPGMCGKLQVSLYGTRDAARNWEEEYTSTLEGWGSDRAGEAQTYSTTNVGTYA